MICNQKAILMISKHFIHWTFPFKLLMVSICSMIILCHYCGQKLLMISKGFNYYAFEIKMLIMTNFSFNYCVSLWPKTVNDQQIFQLLWFSSQAANDQQFFNYYNFPLKPKQISMINIFLKCWTISYIFTMAIMMGDDDVMMFTLKWYLHGILFDIRAIASIHAIAERHSGCF